MQQKQASQDMFFKVKTIATLLDISKDFYSNFVASKLL